MKFITDIPRDQLHLHLTKMIRAATNCRDMIVEADIAHMQAQQPNIVVAKNAGGGGFNVQDHKAGIIKTRDNCANIAHADLVNAVLMGRGLGILAEMEPAPSPSAPAPENGTGRLLRLNGEAEPDQTG